MAKSRTYGKWFDLGDRRTALQFAAENKLNLWVITYRADREKRAQQRRLYAGRELPGTVTKDQKLGHTRADEVTVSHGTNGDGPHTTAKPTRGTTKTAAKTGAKKAADKKTARKTAETKAAAPAKRRGRPPSKRDPLGRSPLRDTPYTQKDLPRAPARTAKDGDSLEVKYRAISGCYCPNCHTPLIIASTTAESFNEVVKDLTGETSPPETRGFVTQCTVLDAACANIAVAHDSDEAEDEDEDGDEDGNGDSDTTADTHAGAADGQPVPDADEREFLAQDDAPDGEMLDREALADAEGYVGDAAEEEGEEHNGDTADTTGDDIPF